MTKKYTFYDDSYYFSNGCDCCEDVYMECYNSDDVMTGLGSAGSIEDCYAQSLITEIDDQDEYSKFYEMNIAELLIAANDLGIKVEIVS